MGKKSKRRRHQQQQQQHGGVSSSTNSTTSSNAHTQQQQQRRRIKRTLNDGATVDDEEEETRDNLKFQDPFVDTLMEEDDDEEQEEEDVGQRQRMAVSNESDNNKKTIIKAWNPLTSTTPTSSSSMMQLEMDESAYKMHYALTAEWPCLSFDFVYDDLGESRRRFPHSLMAVVGTQASSSQRNNNNKNKLQLLKLSDLDKIKVETDDNVLGHEYNGNDNEDDGSDDDDSSVSSVDLDPILEVFDYDHNDGAVNRVRCMPHSTIVATWSEAGTVHLYDVQPLINQCSTSQQQQGRGGTVAASSSSSQPFFTYRGHSNEGFAMDWSTCGLSNSDSGTSTSSSSLLATGDVDGNIHVWYGLADNRMQQQDVTVTPMYESENSVEDIQWSPTESTVLAAAECNGYVKVYDTRAPHRSMLSHRISTVDVNVMSWNTLVGNLLCTGDDGGVVSVWDLRNFKPSTPLARFTCHKTPITSVEWHPTDESMLGVTDNVGTYVYDLSVEEEYTTTSSSTQEEEEGIPPQLLFVHCGSEQFKEVHWHPQITSCLMTTALSGFSVFIPSNL